MSQAMCRCSAEDAGSRAVMVERAARRRVGVGGLAGEEGSEEVGVVLLRGGGGVGRGSGAGRVGGGVFDGPAEEVVEVLVHGFGLGILIGCRMGVFGR